MSLVLTVEMSFYPSSQQGKHIQKGPPKSRPNMSLSNEKLLLTLIHKH